MVARSRRAESAGIADESFIYGDPGDQLFSADWLGTGTDTVAVFRPTDNVVYIKLANETGIADYTWPLHPGFDVDVLGPFLQRVFAITKIK